MFLAITLIGTGNKMSSNLTLVSTLFVVCLIIGVPTLFWPKRIQEYCIKVGDSCKFLKPFILYNLMKTNVYIWNLRIIGFVCLLLALLMLYTMIAHN